MVSRADNNLSEDDNLPEEENLKILDINPGFTWFMVLQISVRKDLSLWMFTVFLVDFWKVQCSPEAYSEPCPTSKMERFVKTFSR